MDTAEAITEIERRLETYPARRYPVQHATAQFHLGTARAQQRQWAEAERALRTAAELFDPERLAGEHAKSLNALGAVYRETGRLDEASRVFEAAEELFATSELPLEQGAAAFNLGLAHRAREHHTAAFECFQRARPLLDHDSAPGQAAAAAREAGACLLTLGRHAEATEVLHAALPLAERAGDTPGHGAAANVLGLSLLGLDRPSEAVTAFAMSAGSHPRSIRPSEHAMAKANLAVAHERIGALDHAWLAAAAAAGTPGAAEPVRAQAVAVGERVGDRPGALVAVLDAEPSERWPVLLREELARWTDAESGERRAAAGAWIDGQVAHRDGGVPLAEAWLGGLLEQPPEAMNTLISATLAALAERDTEVAKVFRTAFSRAVVRFPMPQWMRLQGCFNEAAEALGQERSWA